MASKKRRSVSKTTGAETAAKVRKQEEEYYPINAMMNGVATAFFTVITVLFPLLVGSEKYAQITKFKKNTFLWMAALMIIAAAFALILSYSTSTKKHINRRTQEQRTVPAGAFEKGLDIAQLCFGAGFGVTVLFVVFGPVITTGAKTAAGLVFLIMTAGLAATTAMKFMSRPEEERIDKGTPFSRFLSSLTLADVALIAYWLLMNISAFVSDNPIESIVGLEKRCNGVMIQTFYIVMYFIISRGMDLKAYKLRFYTWSGLVLSLFSICHYFGTDLVGTGFAEPRWGVEMLTIKADRVNKGINFLGTIGNINLLSYILVICLVITAALYIIGETPKWDKYGIVLLVSCPVIAFAERCTRTDAGIVALIAAAGVGVLVLCSSVERLRRICAAYAASVFGWWLHMRIVENGLQHKSVSTVDKMLICGAIMLFAAFIIMTLLKDRIPDVSEKKMRISVVVFCVLAVIGVCALAIHAAKTQSKGTFYEFGQLLMGNTEENFGNGRMKIWSNTVKLIEANPLFGIGPDRFSVVFKAKIGVLFPGKNLDKAHNEFLDVLVCNGILGLAARLTFLGGLIASLVKKMKKCPAAGVFIVAIAAYAIHSFFGYELPIQSPVMWAMLGMAGAAGLSGVKKETV